MHGAVEVNIFAILCAAETLEKHSIALQIMQTVNELWSENEASK